MASGSAYEHIGDVALVLASVERVNLLVRAFGIFGRVAVEAILSKMRDPGTQRGLANGGKPTFVLLLHGADRLTQLGEVGLRAKEYDFEEIWKGFKVDEATARAKHGFARK